MTRRRSKAARWASRVWRRATLDAFGYALPAVDWAFFLAGVGGAVGTAAGLLPPFGGTLWAKVTTILLWLLFAREGYEPLAEAAQRRRP